MTSSRVRACSSVQIGFFDHSLPNKLLGKKGIFLHRKAMPLWQGMTIDRIGLTFTRSKQAKRRKDHPSIFVFMRRLTTSSDFLTGLSVCGQQRKNRSMVRLLDDGRTLQIEGQLEWQVHWDSLPRVVGQSFGRSPLDRSLRYRRAVAGRPADTISLQQRRRTHSGSKPRISGW